MSKVPTKHWVLSEIRRHRVVFVDKQDSFLMRFIFLFVRGVMPDFLVGFLTVIRLPFQRPRVYLPAGKKFEDIDWRIWWHELHHIENFAPWHGPFTVGARYMTQEGRLKEELPAYARDVASGRLTPDQVGRLLNNKYGINRPVAMLAQAVRIVASKYA